MEQNALRKQHNASAGVLIVAVSIAVIDQSSARQIRVRISARVWQTVAYRAFSCWQCWVLPILPAQLAPTSPEVNGFSIGRRLDLINTVGGSWGDESNRCSVILIMQLVTSDRRTHRWGNIREITLYGDWDVIRFINSRENQTTPSRTRRNRGVYGSVCQRGSVGLLVEFGSFDLTSTTVVVEVKLPVLSGHDLTAVGSQHRALYVSVSRCEPRTVNDRACQWCNLWLQGLSGTRGCHLLLSRD